MSNEPTIDEEFEGKLDAINTRIHEALRGEPMRVCYSVASDAEAMPVDNLDEVPIRGAVRLVYRYNPVFSAGGSDFESLLLESPSWLTVAVMANAAIEQTGDTAHRFLEGMHLLRREGGVVTAELSMGS